MMRSVRRLWRNTDGAVAPIIALSLTALIGVGGLAFDYAHLAAMDTELQDAADHAALAAATQLDNASDSQTRATTAAKNLITNTTRFAKQDSTHNGNVKVVTVEFYQSWPSTTTTNRRNTIELRQGHRRYARGRLCAHSGGRRTLRGAQCESRRRREQRGVRRRSILRLQSCRARRQHRSAISGRRARSGHRRGHGARRHAMGTGKLRFPRPARQWRERCRGGPRVQLAFRALPTDRQRHDGAGQRPQRRS